MFEGLTFGWRTAILAVAIGQLLILAIALARTLANSAANRALAALLLVMAGMVTPWAIGFAGFYDRWMGLTFAPFQISLAVAPLGWLYVAALTERGWPDRAAVHLLPAVAQAAYLSGCFLLPLDAKLAWAERSNAAYALLTNTVLIVQMVGYGIAARRRLARYRAALPDHVSETHRYAARWLGHALAALGLLFVVWSGYLLWNLIDPLGYTGLMGLYLAMALVAVYLGIEGWRHSGHRYPSLAELAPAAAPADGRDWTRQGRIWAAQIRERGWSRDPDLTLGSLARLLGTNSAYLSRAINQGEGTNFASFIARLRAEAVAARLDAGDAADLLTIALEEGFGSKASFNRAFAATFASSPSAYRIAVSNHK